MKVKIGNISSLAEARLAASLGADMAGFCLDKTSARYINPLLLSEIISWMSGPMAIGEFAHNENPAAIADMAKMLKLDGVQINAAQWTEIEPDMKDFVAIIHGNERPDHEYFEGVFLLYEKPSAHPVKDSLLSVNYDDNPNDLLPLLSSYTGVDIKLHGATDADSDLYEKLDHWIELLKTRSVG